MCCQIVPKVLVITMYCGEPQFNRCVLSVENQLGVSCTHYIIKNKPNLLAHQELYETINSCGDDFDYYVKLDADMEFSRSDSLLMLLNYFIEGVDYVTIPVFDFMINHDMPALHVYSNRVIFDISVMDQLYVDRIKLNYPGRKLSVLKSYGIVYHCFNPSIEQSIVFGVHRALKLCQYDRLIPDIGESKYHYHTLCMLFKNWKRNPDRKELEYALLAASAVISGEIKGRMFDKKNYMENVRCLDGGKIDKRFSGFSIFSMFNIVGFFRGGFGGLRWVGLKIMKLSFGFNNKKSF